jgi:uncharacterized damage-inducible protein DinB
MASSVDDSEDILAYTLWGHTRILESLQEAEGPPQKAVRLFGHILRAQDLWWGRVHESADEPPELWGEGDLSWCADRMRPSTQQWRDLTRSDDLDQEITYSNSSGDRFTHPLHDIVFHVVNHGTHHRAQIARVLREAGIAPPTTGYIYYLRDRA